MTKNISEYSTPRKCSVCQQPATYWVYKKAKTGEDDLSSPQPRCETHKEQA